MGFYIGDYDPAGVLIDVTLERELREHYLAGFPHPHPDPEATASLPHPDRTGGS